MKLSIIISVRKNSKFITKLLFSILVKTYSMENIEVLCLLNKHDTWNADLPKVLPMFKYFYEDLKMGRAGLHKYFEELLPHTTGDWVLYLCDDHDIVMNQYDRYLLGFIQFHALDSKKIFQIIPRCTNTGSVIHILSRGWIATTGHIGAHANVDSYLNDVAVKIPEWRLKYPQDPVFIDYTCMPEIMTREHCQTEIDPKFIARNYTTDPTVKTDIEHDAHLIIEAIGKGL
jgi:hypothetical protein